MQKILLETSLAEFNTAQLTDISEETLKYINQCVNLLNTFYHRAGIDTFRVPVIIQQGTEEHQVTITTQDGTHFEIFMHNCLTIQDVYNCSDASKVSFLSTRKEFTVHTDLTKYDPNGTITKEAFLGVAAYQHLTTSYYVQIFESVIKDFGFFLNEEDQAVAILPVAQSIQYKPSPNLFVKVSIKGFSKNGGMF